LIASAEAHTGHGSEPVGTRLGQTQRYRYRDRDEYSLPLGDATVALGYDVTFRKNEANLPQRRPI